MIELSIIVPVYNVEKYVHACLESIFKQGLDDASFEVIIVNDGSTDRSMEMIEYIISQHRNITVINQDNKGLSIARNNGIANAKGKYILMPDSDDLLIENSLKPLLEKALETRADLIVADFLTMTDDEINNITVIPQKDFCVKEKTGEQLFLEDHSPYHCFVWRNLYKKEFLINANLSFYPRIRFQDIPFTYKCYLKANKCLKVSWLLNIYRIWPGSSTGSFDTDKAKDFCIAISKTWELTNQSIKVSVCNKIKNNMWISLTVMMRLAIHNIKNRREIADIIIFLKKVAPNLEFSNGIKQRIASFFFKYSPLIFIQLLYIYILLYEDRILPLFRRIKY